MKKPCTLAFRDPSAALRLRQDDKGKEARAKMVMKCPPLLRPKSILFTNSEDAESARLDAVALGDLFHELADSHKSRPVNHMRACRTLILGLNARPLLLTIFRGIPILVDF
jgi:hypothetical protein